MKQKLEALRTKLSQLKEADPAYSVFGTEKHRYLLNPVASDDDLVAFESRFQISLPQGYRAFLLELGNGGAGPYYGLEPIEHGIFADLDYKDKEDLIDPSTPFALEGRWNLDFTGDRESTDEYSKFEEEYFDKKWSSGLLRISNFGCGVTINLVVNGSEYGNIWVDDRCNDGGIYPDPYFDQHGRTEFLAWYELWLDKSLKEVS